MAEIPTRFGTIKSEGCYGEEGIIVDPPVAYTPKNCYDPVNDICEKGHSAGTGSPKQKCCRYCNEFGQNPGGIIVVDGEEVFSEQ